MRPNFIKRIQLENSECLKSFSSLEKKKAKEVLEYAKKLNRSIKIIPQGFSIEWQKEKKKIENKKY